MIKSQKIILIKGNKMRNFFKGLGIGLLCLLVFIIGVVFNTEFLGLKNNSEKTLSFSRDIEVFNELSPTMLSSSLNFSANEELSKKTSVSLEEKELIAKSFDELTKRIKQENFCKGGSYTLEPSYNYYQGNKTLNGYRLYSTFACKFDTNKENSYQKLVKDIEDIISKNSLIAFSAQALQASFDDVLVEENKEKLYDLALEKANEKAGYYSKKLNQTCRLKAIDFDSARYARNAPILAADSPTLPIIKNEKQSLKTNIILECK